MLSLCLSGCFPCQLGVDCRIWATSVELALPLVESGPKWSESAIRGPIAATSGAASADADPFSVKFGADPASRRTNLIERRPYFGAISIERPLSTSVLGGST